MTTITIPKRFVKDDDIVLVPRRAYERMQSIIQLIDESQLWFWTKEWQTKEKEAERDIQAGRLHGPFQTKKQLKAALAIFK
ncbi:MAG TPA: hypothetical protein VFF29_07940 [Bacteroidota bacterium]|nr:hypothetical protein [Bacteroidota bacterium]